MRGSESASGEEKIGRGVPCWAPAEGEAEGEGELRTNGLLRTVERGRPFGGALMVEAARWCRRGVSYAAPRMVERAGSGSGGRGAVRLPASSVSSVDNDSQDSDDAMYTGAAAAAAAAATHGVR
jgi:hypothetical protein